MWKKLAVLALPLAAAACQTARMEVPDALASVQPLPVEGRQTLRLREHIRFGEYESANVDRSWTRGSGMRINRAAREARRQEYTFTMLAAGAPRWTGECEATASSGGVDIAGGQLELQRDASIDCTLAPAATPGAAWMLRLGEANRRPLQGLVTNGPDSWTVRGTTRTTAGDLGEAISGFEVLDEGRSIGAVEVVNDGAVWITPGLSAAERERLAVVAMALLLWRDLREEDTDGE